MPVEYFSWSPMDYDHLGEKLLHMLYQEHDAFLDSIEEDMAQSEDRIATSAYRYDLAVRVKHWCEHFELPISAIQHYDNSIRAHYGRPCSWNLSLNLGQISHNIIQGLVVETPIEDQLYRPKILQRANAEVMKWLKESPKDIDRIHWRSFEAIVAEVLKDKGWAVELTKQTRDGGYDILVIHCDTLGFSETLIVECKLYDIKHSVGTPMVDRLMGVLRRESADKAMLVTNSCFTGVAWKVWEKLVGRDLALVDRKELFEWLAAYGGTNVSPK